ncbi:unnamed protein product [Blepharisma stoltei]|uniref:Steroid 5-alpha reductase C-terminal domain-containing protein n=1 Tax=Blepharisma stoltei TaxID=1481888 RepID=A0AAU9JUM4_9CILI|nr:unnamed protein product [Blepharisma stoltei]
MEKVYRPLIWIVNFAMNEMQDFYGTKLRYIINLQKGGTAPFVWFLMNYYQNFEIGAWAYLVLHGSYGIVWLIKDCAFPDKNFDKKVSVLAITLVSAVLLLYWVLPWLLISRTASQIISPERIAISVSLVVIGVCIMIASDAQKYFTLEYKKGLISEGMFSYSRNPNYFGEILIYLGFGVLVGHWLSYTILFTIWTTIFMSLMIQKDQSLKKKDGWNEYKKRSWILLPKLVPSSSTLTIGIYAIIFSALYLKIA